MSVIHDAGRIVIRYLIFSRFGTFCIYKFFYMYSSLPLNYSWHHSHRYDELSIICDNYCQNIKDSMIPERTCTHRNIINLI